MSNYCKVSKNSVLPYHQIPTLFTPCFRSGIQKCVLHHATYIISIGPCIKIRWTMQGLTRILLVIGSTFGTALIVYSAFK